MPELPSTVEEALASGEWKEVVDPQTGRKYYYNKKTRMTTYNLKRTLQELMEKQKEQERKEKYAQRVRSQRAKEEEDGNVDGAPAASRQPDMGNNNGNSNSTKAAEGPSTISKKSPPTAKVKEESDNAVEKSAFRGKRGTAPVPPPVGIESAEDAVSGGPPKPDESVESLLSRVDHALSGNVRDGNEDPKQGESHVDVALALSNFNDTEEDVQRFLQHWIGSDPGHLRNHVETLQLAERRVSLAEARNQVLTSELEDTRKKLAAANETIAKLEHTLYKTQCCLYYGTSDVRGPAALTHPRATRAQAEAIRAKRREQYTAVLPAHSIAHQGASSLCKEDIYERAAYLQETVATLQELNCRLRSELDHVRASRPCDYCTKHRLRNRTDPALPEPEIAWITDRVRGTQHLPSVAQMLCPHHLDTFLTLDRPMEEADDSQVSAVPWSPHTGPQKRCHVYPSHPLYDDRQTEGRYLIPQNGFPSYVTLAANPFRVGSMMKF